MISSLRFFRIQKDERLATALFFLWQLGLQMVVIVKYWPLFSRFDAGSYRKTVLNNFHISGFDPLTYLVVSDWNLDYDVTRHPLLAFFYYPLYLLNYGLRELTGTNFAPILVSIVLLFCSVYSFLFMIRIGRELIGLGRKEAALLGFMLFSFAYVLLAAISPDHFVLSLFMLTLTLYISGRCIKEQRRLRILPTFLLFFFTAGISLNNGLKVFMANFFTNRKAFFLPANLIFAIILPGALFFYAGRWQDHRFKDPVRAAKRQQEARLNAKEKTKMYAAFKDTTSIKDTALQSRAFIAIWQKHLIEKKKRHDSKPMFRHNGKQLKNFPLHSWTDISTPRIPTIVENLFGQGIQLHQKHTLGDVLRDRPVFVSYDWVLNYVVEGIVVLLFICGIFAGWRHRLLWIALSCFLLDAALNLGLGFGIIEVYIMTSGWAFAIPVSVGYLIARLKGRSRTAVTALSAVITLYLMMYNTTLFLLNF